MTANHLLVQLRLAPLKLAFKLVPIDTTPLCMTLPLSSVLPSVLYTSMYLVALTLTFVICDTYRLFVIIYGVNSAHT